MLLVYWQWCPRPSLPPVTSTLRQRKQGLPAAFRLFFFFFLFFLVQFRVKVTMEKKQTKKTSKVANTRIARVSGIVLTLAFCVSKPLTNYNPVCRLVVWSWFSYCSFSIRSWNSPQSEHFVESAVNCHKASCFLQKKELWKWLWGDFLSRTEAHQRRSWKCIPHFTFMLFIKRTLRRENPGLLCETEASYWPNRGNTLFVL